MKHLQIDGIKITDWKSFHSEFKEKLGFPEYYGQNMNAWIDCLTYIDDPYAGMTTINIGKGETLVIEILNSEEFKKKNEEIYLALFECSAFVNERRIADKDFTMIAIALT